MAVVREDRRGELWLLLAIVALAALLRAVCFSGTILVDDTKYVERAHQIATQGFLPPASYFAARLGVVAPAALIYRLFGTTPLTTAVYPFACSMLSVLVAYVLGRRLVGTGLLPALLVAIFPLDVLSATVLMATTPETLFSGAAVGLFLLAERERRSDLQFDAGICLGLAGVVHETSVLLLVFYPFYSLVVARPSRRQLWFALGLVAGFGVDPLVNGLCFGDPLLRVMAAAHSKSPMGVAHDVVYKGFNVEWLGEPFWRSLTEQELGLFPWIVGPLAVWRIFRPTGPIPRALALLLVVVWLWLSYGSLSPFTYAPLPRLPRYLAPLVLPSAWLLSAELASRGRRLRLAVLALLSVSTLACLVADGGRGKLGPYEMLRDRLAAERPRSVLVEKNLRFGLLLVEHFQPTYALNVWGEGPSGELVAAKAAEVRGAVEARGATLVAELRPDPTIYERLLASPPMMALLRHTRNHDRIEDLERKSHRPAIALYRLP